MNLSLSNTPHLNRAAITMSAMPEQQNEVNAAESDALLSQYVSTLSYIERLHRLLLDVIKDDFERLKIIDVTSVQALILFNIGDKEVTAGELKSRGYYQGSNVSYNLKKLVEGDYIQSERCSNDRRAVRLNLTDKGQHIRQIVRDLWVRQVEALAVNGVMHLNEFSEMERSMRTLERFWADNIRYLY